MTNQEVYIIARELKGIFSDYTQHIPAKVNYYLQSNTDKFINAAVALEKERFRIISNYGEFDENDQPTIKPENIDAANAELSELLALESDVVFKKIPLSWFDGLSFTPKQMKTLLFMIEED